MIEKVRDLFASKKTITMLIGVAVLFAGRLGFELDTELLFAAAGLIGILIHAQGQTDAGKEAARIYADADGDGIPDDEDPTPNGEQ